MALHTWHRQGLCKPRSCTTFMLSSHWGRAATGKKILHLCRQGMLRSCPTLCNPVDYGLPGFSLRGVLQARILERIGQYWLPYPSRALLFPAALAANSAEYLVLPEPLRPKQRTTSTPGPHRDKPKSSRAASGANLSGRPTC